MYRHLNNPPLIRKAGFTLIELSLVLVVVAGIMTLIVIGGRKMSMQSKLIDTVFTLQKYSSNVRDYLSQFNESNNVFSTAVLGINAQLVAAGDVVPSELKINGNSTVVSPFGLTRSNIYSEIIALTFANPAQIGGLGPYYGLFITNIDYAQCVGLITYLASTDDLVNQNGIVRVKVVTSTALLGLDDNGTDLNTASTGYVPANKMVDGATSGNSCKKDILNNILFAYRLR